MKFWNKHPGVRKRHWTRVVLPPDEYPGRYAKSGQEYRGWFNRGPFNDIFDKLQQHDSKGKFYMTIMKKEIWFEHGADATWFMLIH